MIEVKTAKRSWQMHQDILRSVFNAAISQGKIPVIVVEFPDFTATINITRKL